MQAGSYSVRNNVCLQLHFIENIDFQIYWGGIAQNIKPVVHFMIQAPHLADMLIDIL